MHTVPPKVQIHFQFHICWLSFLVSKDTTENLVLAKIFAIFVSDSLDHTYLHFEQFS